MKTPMRWSPGRDVNSHLLFRIALIKRIVAVRDNFRRSNFCKDHCDKIEVPPHLVVEDLLQIYSQVY